MQFNAYLSICNAVTFTCESAWHECRMAIEKWCGNTNGEVAPLWVRREAGPLGSYGGGNCLWISQYRVVLAVLAACGA